MNILEIYSASCLPQNIHCCSAGERFFTLSGTALISPVKSEDGYIRLETHVLHNIPPYENPDKLFFIRENIFYVSAINENKKSFLYCYKLTYSNDHRISIVAVQESFGLSFRPLTLVLAKDPATVLIVTGDDKKCHVYTVAEDGGTLYRNKDRQAAKELWKERLQYESAGDSFVVQLLVEQGPWGIQAATGNSNGLLTWYFDGPMTPQISSYDAFSCIWPSTMTGGLRSSRSDSNLFRRARERIDENGADLPWTLNRNTDEGYGETGGEMEEGDDQDVFFEVTASRDKERTAVKVSLLFEGIVSSVCRFDIEKRRWKEKTRRSDSRHLVVGTTAGIAAVVALKCERCSTITSSQRWGGSHRCCECRVLLPGSEAHGSVQCIAVDDLNNDAYDDVAVGFGDGTVLLITRSPGPRDEKGKQKGSLLFTPLQKVSLHFPIYFLAVGSFLGSDGFMLQKEERSPPKRQLIIQTAKTIHVLISLNL